MMGIGIPNIFGKFISDELINENKVWSDHGQGHWEVLGIKCP